MITNLCKVCKDVVQSQHRFINTTAVRPLIQKWRQENRLPLNPNAYGVLTDKPDFTYLDGRPTPLGSRQKERIMKQKELAHKIISLTQEVDFAVERHKRMQIEKEKHRQNVLESKLKPKGNLLLKKK